MFKISVLGAGGWGIALALSALGNGHNVTIWTPFCEEAELLSTKRTNEKLLSGIKIPEEIKITTDLNDIEGSNITIIATPSTAVRGVAKALKNCKDFGIVVNVAKGFEKGSLKTLSDVLEEELPDSKIAVLSGPSHAEEVARNIPTSVVAASKSLPVAEIVQNAMSSEFLRVYTSTDLIGVEIGGALKNVIAVCAGFCDGIGLGDNTKAALITRGLAEMTRLGVCMGAREYTFSGLTGLGDLIVTATSRHSRNNRFGNKVGSGTDVKTALSEVGTVEGYYATEMAYELSRKYNLDLPIIEECYGVLYKGNPVKDVVRSLMLRPKRREYTP